MMNWITELGQQILRKMGLRSEQPTARQKAVQDAVKKFDIKPTQVVTQSETDVAARIYHKLQDTSTEGTSVEWKRAEMKNRLVQKFPGMTEARQKELTEALYA